MVSAVKVDGKRLHELAREGKEVEREPRPVTVYRYDVEPTDEPLVFRAEVECSSGTYVRTLAADLGTALGGGAHLRNLRRTRIGSFGEDEAAPVNDVVVLTPGEGLRDYPAVTIDAGTDKSASWGPGIALVWPKRVNGSSVVRTSILLKNDRRCIWRCAVMTYLQVLMMI